MYSNVLPGFQIEIQLKSLEMHKQAEHGSASHDAYKKYLGDDGAEDPINKVFVVDDFSELNIIGFTSYESKENDQDGIHFAKEFSDRQNFYNTGSKKLKPFSSWVFSWELFLHT